MLDFRDLCQFLMPLESLFYRSLQVIHDYKSYLFNFSYSYMGGALKRILAYLRWFNEQGGACFVLNNRLKGIEKKFPNNRYCFLRQYSIAKILNYSLKLNQFIYEVGPITLYYSYGVPLPYVVGRINWYHLGNVLTLINSRKFVTFRRFLELQLLGILTKRGMKYANIISAESESSLNLLDQSQKNKLVVSVNGSNEEIEAYKSQLDSKHLLQPENIVVTVGTCQYKCI